MAVIRHASTPMVDLTALVKKDTCWQTMASLVKVCVYACQLLCQILELAFISWDNNNYNWCTHCSMGAGYLEPRKTGGAGGGV